MRPAYNGCSKSTRLEVTKNDPPDILVRTPNHPERPLQVLVAQRLFRLRSFKPALNSKGLRRNLHNHGTSIRFKPALNSKGLRLQFLASFNKVSLLQASPEFKGIKTAIAPDGSVMPAASSQP